MHSFIDNDPNLHHFSSFVSKELGDNTFQEIVVFASHYFQVDYVHIALLQENLRNVEVIAAYLDGKLLEPGYIYALEGTPCANVIYKTCKGYPDHVQELFPNDADLVSLQAQSYIGEPLIDNDGNVIGLIVLVSRKTLPFSEKIESLMRILAGRASIEISRQNVVSMLRKEHENLQLILDYAPIGIWLQNTQGKIGFVNKAFTQAVGIPEEEFLAVDHYMELIPDAFKPQCIASDEKALATQGVSISYQQLPFVDGKIHDLKVIKAVKRDQKGKPLALVGLSIDITDEVIQQKQLEHIAHYDPLTGLPNRILNAKRLNQAMQQADKNGTLVAVLFLDLDGFKHINDLYGHEIGDEVLTALSHNLSQLLREEDTLSRLGGDEFIAILADLPSTAHASSILAGLMHSFTHPLTVDEKTFHITASIGVALYPQKEPVDGDQLLRQADLAMYAAKQSGKNRYHIFDSDHDHTIRTRHQMVQKIKDALGKGEFELYYQPKVNMKSGTFHGAEALIRWNHPTEGIIYPGAFLHCIENETLAIEIGEWVISSALEQLSHFHTKGYMIGMSVNVGASQLLNGDFYERLKSILDKHPAIDPHFLEIEILETSALENLDSAVSVMDQCISLGVRFSLDDFGTGYSSLSYLKKLPISTLKIDQSFVRDILTDPDDLVIVQGIISLAHAFGKKLIAEGVESAEIAKKLIELGCKDAQGYWIGKPMQRELFCSWIEEWKSYPGL